ncbi:hypothetical protein FIM10_01975 [Sphingomonadales bacterium 56]|uniref:hypothetical protein n=1 Tax=unclassified Sphingobium TaxID=2611147 RepID=UPI00191AD5FF|nr:MULTISPECIES: hypothetical protein [unclassified Sphingobium]MBY2927451.1 hypothetical protein [Sphingomonadales bacterium 56]MBY2957519.1 hypothetical protein [Sphingomonadales bacterium 58]MBY2957562.1 hypothetical protein [Sphingomonadales bacterium 58]CAD7335229.1 hypothetical protein SPHS8_00402 [Sphingobium sp. S8]CAD7335248.1 hypothetical protein SPHS6_00402 [Sphingobium sp. S6]
MTVAERICRVISEIHAAGGQPARIYIDEHSVSELERNGGPWLVSKQALRGTARKFMGIVITTGAIANPPRVIDTTGKAYSLDQESRAS